MSTEKEPIVPSENVPAEDGTDGVVIPEAESPNPEENMGAVKGEIDAPLEARADEDGSKEKALEALHKDIEAGGGEGGIKEQKEGERENREEEGNQKNKEAGEKGEGAEAEKEPGKEKKEEQGQEQAQAQEGEKDPNAAGAAKSVGKSDAPKTPHAEKKKENVGGRGGGGKLAKLFGFIKGIFTFALILGFAGTSAGLKKAAKKIGGGSGGGGGGSHGGSSKKSSSGSGHGSSPKSSGHGSSGHGSSGKGKGGGHGHH
jgi:hypothetical protein